MILAKVNGEEIATGFAVARSILHDEEFFPNSVKLVLLQQYARDHGISVSTEELQLAADEMRYQNGLETVAKLEAWLQQHQMTVLTVQNAIEGMLIRNKVRGSIPESEVESYYLEHRLDFETVELYSLRVAEADLAEELAKQIREGAADFHQLAMAHSTDDSSAHLGGYIGELHRADVTAEIEAAVFDADAGEVVGPIQTRQGYNLFKIRSRQQPSLEEMRDDIRFDLFEALLARLGTEAQVEMTVLHGLD